jgi:hypothetical protein
MLGLISELRMLSSAVTNDVFDGVTYWTDDQLEAILDRNSVYHLRHPLIVHPIYEDGSISYRYWRITDHNRNRRVEDDPEIVNYWGVVQNEVTVDVNMGIVTFDNSPSKNAKMFINMRVFFMADAVAEVWAAKAAQRAPYVDFRAGVQRGAMQQEYQHCVEQHRLWRARTMRGHKRL